jgi:hypothetical protein
MRVCVCVHEGERESGRVKEREREKGECEKLILLSFEGTVEVVFDAMFNQIKESRLHATRDNVRNTIELTREEVVVVVVVVVVYPI